ncbi:F0F1 ATP synthase subunit A [Henriciella aquimarina]|uniref:F0F1 ATP synthase subunit A n=1 Tax=Henriciella aquimarina TaxID=545261 RepID=UPI000A01FB05|nr:F0F1 ATP synthase subunit A [Henriciella aquimarina]
MRISPDEWVLYSWRELELNATIAFTWLVMALITGASWLATRRLSETEDISPFQNFLEVLVTGLADQIRDVSRQEPGRYLPFVGTLFVFIAVSNLLSVVPGYVAPTGSLSTTVALALCVFVAVPLFGIASRGLFSYLREYLRPTPLMLPFTVISELSRTIALAVRLYGNVMSGAMIAGILISIAPFFFPVVMQLLGLITGLIQAYIFAILAMVYIASATQASHRKTEPDTQSEKES